ncbi:hypothetical protein RJT34_27855 [Clitoria ternatea]|uniref:Transmembrane protein n=1 Tax=Clitoria ternatea TaxID=43366 RepID=A0AAN9F840_CLITE
MEMKRRENEREITKEEEEHKEDSVHTIVFTAGTFFLMVCLKHFLVEQWRAWVFLILNVILLAIMFMSMRSSYRERSVEEVQNEKRKPRECTQEVEEGKECHKKQCWGSSTSSSDSTTHVDVKSYEIEEDDVEEEEEEEEHVPVLSKEELNERVEAFIAMFRQHLISDVKQAESFRLHKIEVSCF